MTDHHVIDPNFIRQMQKHAGDDLTVFPGIELRTDLGGRHTVHIIGIFPEDTDLNDLQAKVSVPLHITEAEIQEKGQGRVYVRFTDAAEVIHDLGGIVTVHAGSKSNTIEGIANAPEFKQQVKEDLVREHVDILEIGKPEDADAYTRIVLPNIDLARPLIIGSDCHNAGTYSPSARCWLKADVTFAGLRQIVNEPEGRVYLGDEPPLLSRVRTNPTKYIQSLSFSRTSDCPTDEGWFDGQLKFSYELIAIIGNKGSGKSALADILGLLGNSPREESFSFLNEEKFRNSKLNKAKCFKAEIVWESGDIDTRRLDEHVNSSAVEKIKYIPQNYLETICNELVDAEESQFARELRAVIFSHVDTADRLSMETLDDLINYRTQETEDAIRLLREVLREQISQWVALSEKGSEQSRKSAQNRLNEKKKELEAHKASKPDEVPEPAAEPATKDTVDINKKIEEKAVEVAALETTISSLRKRRAEQAKIASAAEKLLARINNFDRSFQQFKTETFAECQALGIDLDTLVTLQIDVSTLETKRTAATRQGAETARRLDPANEEGEEHNRVKTEEEIAELKKQLDEPNRLYQAYRKASKDWEDAKAKLIGDVETVGSLCYLKAQLGEIKEVPTKLPECQKLIDETTGAIYDEISGLADVYRELYEPVQRFIQSHELVREPFRLEFRVSITQAGFEDRFLGVINQNKRGSFHGLEEGRTAVRRLLEKADFGTKAGLNSFLSEVFDQLGHDRRNDGDVVIALGDQIRKSEDLGALLYHVYGLEYLNPDYSLRWADKDLGQLSPGERGTLLLIFYLLIDRSDIPLVIDQPEENLDNQTVYEVLVYCIKEAKARRQIVIVTHNPNLAVVCDAEQIIYASLDRDGGNRIAYTTGAIENPVLNPRTVDVLEGTRPAFENRGRKYSVLQSD